MASVDDLLGWAEPPLGDRIAEWLHGKSRHTQRAYAADLRRFLEPISLAGEPFELGSLKMSDVQAFLDASDGSGSTKARQLAAIRSFFAFLVRQQHMESNPAAGVRVRRGRETIADRILDEEEIYRMIALEPDSRNRLILRVLYNSGARIEELAALTWKDVLTSGTSGQIVLYGKGDKTRSVGLSAATWNELLASRLDAPDEAPVFPSRRGGGHLRQPQMWRIVRRAAQRAGLDKEVSPHWMRHAHASHALDRGAPLHLVQATLGHASASTTGRYLHARPEDSSARYLGI